MTVQLDLANGRLFARNTLINLAGEVLPFFTGLLTIPIVLHGIGADSYGIVTLSAMVVGYFGLFDFGLGSAATKLISEAAGTGQLNRIPDLFWTSLVLMFVFGVIGAISIVIMSPWLVGHLFHISPALHADAMRAFSMLALSLPFVISGGSLRGSLAAFQRFDLLNSVNIPTGIFSYLGPLLVLPFSDRPSWFVAVMVFGRLVAWIVSLYLCCRVVPNLRSPSLPSWQTIRSMLRFGGWVTITNVVGPIMMYFDRFLIGSTISMAAVTYYNVSYQLATKLFIIPSALGGVAFAAFSGTIGRDPKRTAVLFERAILFILCTLLPLAFVLVALAPEGLRLWLDAGFARDSTNVLRWLAIGAFVNGIAQMPYLLVIAGHRPDLTAKLHLIEVPFYCLFLWWVLPHFGITGAAMAWTLRVFVDTLVLFSIAWRLLPNAQRAILRTVPLTLLATLFLCSGFMFQTYTVAIPVMIAMLLFAALGVWMLVLKRDEKDIVCEYLGKIFTFSAGTRKLWF